MLCYAILCYAMLCYAILCYTMLYYAILYYTILYYTILYYSIVNPALYLYRTQATRGTEHFGGSREHRKGLGTRQDLFSLVYKFSNVNAHRYDIKVIILLSCYFRTSSPGPHPRLKWRTEDCWTCCQNMPKILEYFIA